MALQHSYPLAVILCIVLIIYCKPAFSEPYTLNVAVPPFAPFAFFQENKQCKGASVEILNRIAQHSGLTFQHVLYPYARILTSLKNGEIDMALVFKNASVKGYVNYIGPVSKSQVVVLTQLNHPIKQYQQLHNLKAIAVIRKAQFDNAFDIDEKINKVSVESYLRALQMFARERVDAVVGSFSGLEYSMKQLSMDSTLLDNAFILGHKEWWLHISNKSSILKSNDNVKSKISSAVTALYEPRMGYQTYKQQIQKCGL